MVINGAVQVPTLNFQSSLTLQPVQTITLPVESQSPYTLRLLSTPTGYKAPVFVLSTPTERAAATSQGSSLWVVGMRPWSEQINELVDEEHYSDALTLLDSLDAAALPDQVNPHTFVIFFADI